ncbi:MAG: hypothetical protein ACPG4Z_06435 [Chitinophagales bacterium]
MKNPNGTITDFQMDDAVYTSMGIFGSLLFQVIMFLLQCMAFYTLLFLRYRFGERKLNFLVILGASVLAYILSLDVFLIGGWLEIIDANSIAIFYRHLTIFFLLSILHLIHLRIRTRIFNERWYSQNEGISILYKIFELLGLSNLKLRIAGRTIFTVRQHTFWKYIEPVIVIFIGVSFMKSGMGFYGFFLIVSGSCIAITTQLQYYMFRRKILNILDGKIEASFISNLPEKGIVSEKTLEEYYGIDDFGAIHSREEIDQISVARTAKKTPKLSELELNPQ